MAEPKEVKPRSAPLPLRAIGDERLAGLDLRVIACIAAHDRMSLKTGKGQGCWASHETLAAEIGCNYINLGKSIKKLGVLGYVERSKPTFGDQRGHVYRIPGHLYDYEESLSFGKGVGRAARGADLAGTEEKAPVLGEMANEPAEVVCQGQSENGVNSSGSPEQYISLSDETYSVETGKDTPLKEARLTSRDDFTALCSSNDEGVSEAQGLGEGERGPTVGGEMARFERAFKAGRFRDDGESLLGWVKWLEGVQEDHCGEPLGYQASRLCEDAIEALPEPLFRKWQQDDSPRTIIPVETVIGEPDAIRLQVAAFYEQADKPRREALARRAGLPMADLRSFVQGRMPHLSIGKQVALRTAAKEAA